MQYIGNVDTNTLPYIGLWNNICGSKNISVNGSVIGNIGQIYPSTTRQTMLR